MELEKKKKTQTKVTIRGPVIRYQSVTMPLIENDDEDFVDVVVQPSLALSNCQNQTNSAASAAKLNKQSRNFIIFSDEHTLQQLFPTNKQKPPDVTKKLCSITGLPAKYFDPITQKPYANLFAFKTLRGMHAKKSPEIK